jgi:hypothetical protein
MASFYIAHGLFSVPAPSLAPAIGGVFSSPSDFEVRTQEAVAEFPQIAHISRAWGGKPE